MKFPKNIRIKKPEFIRDLRIMLSVGAIAVIVVTVMSIAAVSSNNPTAAQIKENKQNLQSKVDSPDGSPRPGRDPANKKQASLAMAASSPTGAGGRAEQPASNVQGSQDTQYKPSDVYGDPKKSGINSAGCFYDYGEPGQCIPAHIAENGKLTCAAIHSKTNFHSGVKVSGKEDRFNLDTNNDGTACGSGDTAA